MRGAEREREGRKVHFNSEHQTLLIKLTEEFLLVGITSPFLHNFLSSAGNVKIILKEIFFCLLSWISPLSSLWNIQTQSKSISVTIIFNEQSCYCCCNSVCERERERCFDLSRNTMPPQLSGRWWQVTLTGDLRRPGHSLPSVWKYFSFTSLKYFLFSLLELSQNLKYSETNTEG